MFSSIRPPCWGLVSIFFLFPSFLLLNKLGGLALCYNYPGGRAADWTSEFAKWHKIGDPVPHIELRRWADLLLIAPASANVLAELSGGLGNSLFLSVARAWQLKGGDYVDVGNQDGSNERDEKCCGSGSGSGSGGGRWKPAILAPAMNTLMWTHPSTSQALSNLEAWGYQGECLNGLDGYNLTYSSYIYVFLQGLSVYRD